jgi:hypothetical protein
MELATIFGVRTRYVAALFLAATLCEDSPTAFILIPIAGESVALKDCGLAGAPRL